METENCIVLNIIWVILAIFILQQAKIVGERGISTKSSLMITASLIYLSHIWQFLVNMAEFDSFKNRSIFPIFWGENVGYILLSIKRENMASAMAYSIKITSEPKVQKVVKSFVTFWQGFKREQQNVDCVAKWSDEESEKSIVKTHSFKGKYYQVINTFWLFWYFSESCSAINKTGYKR